MYPIFARTDYGFIYSFTLIWWLALFGSFIYLRRQTAGWRWLDGALVALVAALLGGRMQFVWLNQLYFNENPQEIWEMFSGGFGYHGVVVGALLGSAVYHRLTDHDWSAYLIQLTPLLPILHTLGWIACWLEGCAYGRISFIGWATAELPDSYGIWEVRYQTQLAGILLTGLIALLWWRLSQHRPKNRADFWRLLFTMQGIYLLITFWRGDEMPIWQGGRIDGWLSAVIMGVCLIVLIFNQLQSRTIVSQSVS